MNTVVNIASLNIHIAEAKLERGVVLQRPIQFTLEYNVHRGDLYFKILGVS